MIGLLVVWLADDDQNKDSTLSDWWLKLAFVQDGGLPVLRYSLTLPPLYQLRILRVGNALDSSRRLDMPANSCQLATPKGVL